MEGESFPRLVARDVGELQERATKNEELHAALTAEVRALAQRVMTLTHEVRELRLDVEELDEVAEEIVEGSVDHDEG